MVNWKDLSCTATPLLGIAGLFFAPAEIGAAVAGAACALLPEEAPEEAPEESQEDFFGFEEEY